MPVVVYRQPWFWAVIAAVVALFVFGIVIAASGPGRDGDDSTTVIQQPAPAENDTQIVPIPGASQSAPPAQPAPPAPPAEPARPVEPEKPAPSAAQPPQVIRERETVIIKEQPKPQPAPQARPSEDRSAAPPPPPGAGTGQVIAQDVFERTGLPKQMEFEDTRWEATRTVTVTPDKRLREAGTTEDGMTIMVSENAQEPFQTVLIATPDDPERYVEYRRR